MFIQTQPWSSIWGQLRTKLFSIPVEPFDFYYRKIRSSFPNCKSEGIIPSLLQLEKKEVSKEGTKELHEGTEKRRNVMKERRNVTRKGGTKEHRRNRGTRREHVQVTS